MLKIEKCKDIEGTTLAIYKNITENKTTYYIYDEKIGKQISSLYNMLKFNKETKTISAELLDKNSLDGIHLAKFLLEFDIDGNIIDNKVYFTLLGKWYTIYPENDNKWSIPDDQIMIIHEDNRTIVDLQEAYPFCSNISKIRMVTHQAPDYSFQDYYYLKYMDSQKLMCPPVKQIEYDKVNDIINIVDTVWLDQEKCVDIYFSINREGKLIGFIYTDALDSMQGISFDIQNWESYSEFKYQIAILINKKRKNRVLNHQENQLKFIKAQKGIEINENKI